WESCLGELDFGCPTAASLQLWLKLCDNRVNPALSCLGALRNASLEQLLEVEQMVSDAARSNEILPEAPIPSVVPNGFPTLCPGQERKKPGRYIERFSRTKEQIGNAGKVFVAACVLAAVVWVGQSSGHATITVFNALGRSVHVKLGSLSTDVPAYGHRNV